MDFQKRKLHENPKKRISKKAGLMILIVLIGIFYVFKLMTSGAGLKEFVLSLGKPLKVDAQGHTNFLFMGTGGELHDGADLTDSILIVSIDSSTKSATMMSIPRDLYIDTKMGTDDRINKIYTLAKNEYQDSRKALELLAEATSEVVGIDIHYYVKINFEGFAEIVDMIGGVDIFVDETIDDPTYPKEGTIYYKPFFLSKGLHHLDGETALKYARSRKTTSDFDRSHRQQKLLFAIKDEAIEQGIASDPDKIKDIFLSLKEDIETNLSMREIIKLAEIGKNLSKNNIKTFVLHDNPSQCGGFLYTPERSEYGGAFVLIPASNPFIEDDHYDYLNFFTKKVFPEIGSEFPEIQILNGTESVGLAGQVKVLLKRHCFNVFRYGNAESSKLLKTKIYTKTDGALQSKTVRLIQEFLGTGEITADIPMVYRKEPYLSDAEILLELGADYGNSPNKDPFDYLIDMVPKKVEEVEVPETLTTEE